MDTVGRNMMKVFRECDVCFNGNVISRELLLQTFTEFISKTIECDSHNIGIVMHTGSVCFDAVLLSFAAVSNILYNGSDPEETVRMLSPGDTVLYYEKKGKERHKFLGFVNSLDDKPGKEGRIAVLEQEGKSHLKNYVPFKKWSKIVPYYGTSASMDGRGLRKDSNNKHLFYKNVLGIDADDIPRTIDTSTVFIMSRDYAEEIINGLTFTFPGGTVRLTDLVTATYYTEDQEYPYPGNEAKSEAIIKITSRVSVARKILLRKGGNRHIGLIVLGDELIRRGELDLPDLIGRKSIQYVYLCSNLDSEIANRMLTTEESAKLFACTKDFLLSYSLPPRISNPLTEALHRQTDAVIKKEVEPVTVSGCLNWENYKSFKEAIFLLKSSDYDSKEKEAFVIQAYSLMNLFLTAVFPLSLLNGLVLSGKIENTAAPKDRLQKIRDNFYLLPEYLRTEAGTALKVLEETYQVLENSCPKDFRLRRILAQCKNKKIAIVVPKAYFATVINGMGVLGEDIRATVVSANKFDNKELYDIIIVVGNIEGTRFNMFRSRSARRVYTLLYEPESLHFKKASAQIERAEREYRKRAVIEYEVEPPEETEEEQFEVAAEEVERIDNELKKYFSDVAIRSYGNYIGDGSSKNVMSEIVSIATFDTEEIAFFSKNYSAYVLDEKEKKVKEVKATELSEGDTIIFTRSTDKTRDVVDDLLRKMIDERRVAEGIEEAYHKSHLWKRKLIDYMTETGNDAATIASKMIKNGVSVQEPTIKGWLDEDSHTVGPRKLDSIQQIALLTGDEAMFDGAKDIFDACATVRRIRGRIMDAIARAVLSGITGDKGFPDPIFDVVYEHVGELSVMRQIESVTFVKESVPVGIINRPVVVE